MVNEGFEGNALEGAITTPKTRLGCRATRFQILSARRKENRALANAGAEARHDPKLTNEQLTGAKHKYENQKSN
jgi:hypothetical protein